MATPGHYKALRVDHPLLELKRAGKDHLCAGILVERGARPDRFRDAWMVGHAKRCCKTIEKGDFYLSNRMMPDFLQPFFMFDSWPTCMFCGIEFFDEYIEGDAKLSYVRPVTPELRQEIVDDTVRTLAELRKTVISPSNSAAA